MRVDELCHWLTGLRGTIEGLTISGGEPLQQRTPVTDLLQWVRRNTALSVVLFTGYDWGEMQALPGAAELLAGVDVLIAGRYDQRRRFATALRGSANKTVHLLTNRYSRADIEAVPQAEVVVGTDGAVTISGIDPIQP